MELCGEAGVALFGFNFWPRSKRYVTPEAAAPLVARVRGLPVGLFVNASVEEVARAVEISGVEAIQLHGDEDPADFVRLGVSIIQVLKVQGSAFPEATLVGARLLLDAAVEGYGGQGQRFAWSAVEAARSRYGVNPFIAGGLTPQNVGELVAAHRPGGVDVASGVESAPGVKDGKLVRAFVKAVQEAEEQR